MPRVARSIVSLFVVKLMPVLILFLLACEGDNTIIIVEERLPKLDCSEYVKHVVYGFGNRGTIDSSFAKRAIAKAKADCEEENRRRGY